MNQKLFELIDLVIQSYITSTSRNVTPTCLYKSQHDPIFSSCVNIRSGQSLLSIDIIVEDYIKIILYPNNEIRISGSNIKSRLVPMSEMIQLCSDVKKMDDTQLLLTWGKLDLLTTKIPINSIDYFYAKKYLISILESLKKE